MAGTNKTLLGKYELLAVIGDGAEGRVYKAICAADDVPDVPSGEFVAIKRFKNTGHERESRHFLRQVQILGRLDHPNIVRHKHSFIWREKELEEDVYCLVMELLEGESLKSLIERGSGKILWEQVRDVLKPILEALNHANQSGIVHRDLKPSNIYITANGTPKLIDFGIARQEDGESTATNSVAGAKGTFDYMAPDFALQHGGFRGDEQSDIFSFGVILYYALTGTLPFPPLGEHAVRGYYVRWLSSQMPAASYGPHPIFRVLSGARTCISQCIDPDRKARFKTFKEVMESFGRIGYRRLKRDGEVYEFKDWLGKGGFSEVFKAKRLSDNRDVAVKRLFLTSQSARFIREAKILRGASHPNLTEYVDFVEVRNPSDEPEYYLVLEFLEGMPGAGLKNRISQSENGLDPAEVLELFIGYLDCLEHLHKKGIIHRDIKPANLYAPANNPQKGKIFDLGIAHDEEGTHTHGQVPGTLDFMPPEFAVQSSGRGSPQSDIYSLGVSLYLSLTKKLPYPALPQKEEEKMWLAFFQRAQNPLECPFDHPSFKAHPELIRLVRHAIAQDPRKRFESASAMNAELRRILKSWRTSAISEPDEHPTAITEAALLLEPGKIRNGNRKAIEPAVRPQRLELRSADGARFFVMNQSSVRIGRNRNCDVVARSFSKSGHEIREESLMISQFHAQIDWNGAACRLRDGGTYPEKGWQPSTAGLWVNGQKLSSGGQLDLVADKDYTISLGAPTLRSPFQLRTRLFSAKALPKPKPACYDLDLSPETPVCLMMTRLSFPVAVYFIVRSCAALSWADPRSGQTCLGLRQGRLHLGDTQSCELLVGGREVRAGALKFQVLDMPIVE
jgi:serine/threonine protein kinase